MRSFVAQASSCVGMSDGRDALLDLEYLRSSRNSETWKQKSTACEGEVMADYTEEQRAGYEYFLKQCSRPDRHYPQGANRKFQCPCCLCFTLRECGHYHICKVCFWEDDGCIDPEDGWGPNGTSLGVARLNYLQLGTCEERFLKHVRKPNADEVGPLAERKEG